MRHRNVLIIALLALQTCAQPQPTAQGAQVPLRLIADGLSFPVQVVHDRGERLFVVEQPGRMRLLADGRVASQAYLDITDRVTHQGECGFLGVAFHPQFAANGYFYVNYTTGSGKALRTVISEFHADAGADSVDPATERIVMEIAQPYANHNGGQIHFGPDGMLYIGMGDGGSGGDPQNRAQNPRELLGKMLRIDVNDRSPYAVPQDNPFVNDPRFRPEIWAWGLRNPWRFSFDRETGICYAGDVGQNAWEEIDIIVAGGNYGWRLREGRHVFKREPGATDLMDPIVEYPRDKGWSVTGGVVYRGSKYPQLSGVYVYGDYVSGRFWGLRYVDGKVLANEELNVTIDGKPALNRMQPSSFDQDTDGEVLICDHTRGNIYRMEFAP